MEEFIMRNSDKSLYDIDATKEMNKILRGNQYYDDDTYVLEKNSMDFDQFFIENKFTSVKIIIHAYENECVLVKKSVRENINRSMIQSLWKHVEEKETYGHYFLQ
jgi:hypothetical protein